MPVQEHWQRYSKKQEEEGWGVQIPWRTNISLMDKLKDEESRIWYAYKVIENGWSKTILDLQIESRLMERSGRS